jgi:hypothetical protein
VQRSSRSLLSAFNDLTPKQQLWLVVGAFLVLHAITWLLLELFYYNGRPITDTSIYYHYSNRILNGFFPYRDFSAEYPPVAMLIFLLPRLFSGSAYNIYVYWFELEMFIFSAANMVLLAVVAWKRWRDISRLIMVLALYSLFLLMMGFIVAARFDVAASFLIFACLAAYLHDRKLLAWILLGIGAMTKLIPLLLVPLLLIAHFRRGERSWLVTGPSVMVITALLIAIPFLAASPEGLARTFLYHAERPLQIESSWSTPILIMSFFGYGVRMFSSYGSHNLFTPISNLLAALSAPVTIFFLGIGYWLFGKRLWGVEKEVATNEYLGDQLIRYTAAAILIFIAGGKVLSPQFLIWLVPLIPLMNGPDRNYIFTLFGSILFLTQLEFPFHYGNLLGLHPAIVIEVAVRNLLIIWLAVVLVRKPVPREGLFGLKKLKPSAGPAGQTEASR